MRAALAVCLIAVSAAAGCASVDPTDPSHYTNVLVVNDTSSAVVLVQCDVSCATLHERTALPAGASTVVNVSNQGIKAGYVVESSSGSTLGCLYMRFTHAQTEPAVAISSLRTCA